MFQIDRLTSTALTGLWTLAILYTLKIAEELLIPLSMALFLHLIVRPVFRAMVTRGIPSLLAASLILSVVVALAGTAFVKLKGPAVELFQTLPDSLRTVQHHVEELRRENSIQQTLQEVEQIAESSVEQKTPEVKIKEASVGEMILGWTARATASIVMVFVALFFLLVGWDSVVEKISRLSEKKGKKEGSRLADIIHETEKVISAYFFNFTLINISLGVALGIAMAFLHMPNPALWGVVGGLMNFVPYIGAFITLAVITLVAFMEFPFQHAILIPIAYWTITNLESLFITPLILGRSFTIHPLFIFITITFWGWLWGMAGLFIAIPALMIFRVVCQHTPALAELGEFLQDSEKASRPAPFTRKKERQALSATKVA